MSFNYSQNRFSRNFLKVLMPFWDSLKIKLNNPEVVIHGSYYTTNVGDRVLALIIRNELKKRNVSSVIVSRFSTSFKAKNIIVGGGGILHNHYEDNLEFRTKFLNDNRNVFYLGVGCPGFNEITSFELKKLKLLENAKYISVRDLNSFENLKKYISKNILIRTCPSWLFPFNERFSDTSLRSNFFRLYYNLRFRKLFSKKTISVSRKNIGVVINGHFNLKYLSSIIPELQRLKKNHDLIYIPFVGEDLEFYSKNLKVLGIKCAKLKGPIETMKLVQKMDKMIASRYHSLIFSLLANKPVMVLAYQEKVLELSKDFNLKHFDLINESEISFDFNSVDLDVLTSKKKLAEKQMQEVLDLLAIEK